MAFIGNTPTTQGFIPAVDFFSGNASTVAFTLSRPVASVAQVQAVVENVPQKPGDAYTISGNTITFTSAPPSGTNNIYVYYTSPITQVIAPSQGTVGTSALATGLDVSAGNLSYTGTLTGGTGVVNLGSGQFYKDASGNVGIGATPGAWSGAQVVQLGARGGLMYRTDLTSTELLNNAYHNSSSGYIYQASAAATLYRQSSGAHSWFYASSGTAGNVAGFTQAMTLDSSGNLLVGKTSAGGSVVGVQLLPNGQVFSTLSGSTNSSTTLEAYSTGAGAYRFYVGMGGTVFATSTTISAISDQRLKENVQDLDVGLDAVMALKPRMFDWKEGKGKNIKGDRGWIAQEFEQVFPDMIDEWRDEAPKGEEPYKSVRADLIPVLVKAIQEQQALITSLTARIAALEGAQ